MAEEAEGRTYALFDERNVSAMHVNCVGCTIRNDLEHMNGGGFNPRSFVNLAWIPRNNILGVHAV